ncbi:MAG TPA: XdhC family protein, partial [Novosphingobium sp.]|nr:XdhC family protein [Novosphingobium sp.]
MGDLAALAPFAARAALGWAATARQALATGPVALVTVLATEGSAPLGAGARMVVGQQGLLAGSVGGGALEWRALEQARAILAHAPGTWRVQDYPLGPLLGQCCGGRVRLLVERLDPALAGWLAEAL